MRQRRIRGRVVSRPESEARGLARIDHACACGRALPVGEDCAACEEYRCAGCFRVCSWEFGAGDEWFGFCDDCAVARMGDE